MDTGILIIFIIKIILIWNQFILEEKGIPLSSTLQNKT